MARGVKSVWDNDPGMPPNHDGTSGTCGTNRTGGTAALLPQSGTDADGGNGRRTAARRDCAGRAGQADCDFAKAVTSRRDTDVGT